MTFVFIAPYTTTTTTNLYGMKFTDCRSSVAFFMYCSAAVLVIVNGQPTIDGDIDNDQISKLIDIVDELRAEQSSSAAEFRAQTDKLEDKIAKLEGQSAATSTTKPDASKFNRLPLHSPDCVTFVAMFMTYELYS